MLFQVVLQERVCWRIKAIRVRLALMRVDIALRAYNPGQLRVPAGNSNGGQWTTDDNGNSVPTVDDAQLIFVNDSDRQRYSVALAEEEVRGGHTISRHVGKTDDQMLQRVQKGAVRFLLGRGGIRRDGSFASVSEANDLVNQTLQNNSGIVDRVTNGDLEDEFIKSDFPRKTGREAYSTNDGIVYLRDTFGVGVLIIHDVRSSQGYRVHTAYPRTEGD